MSTNTHEHEPLALQNGNTVCWTCDEVLSTVGQEVAHQVAAGATVDELEQAADEAWAAGRGNLSNAYREAAHKLRHASVPESPAWNVWRQAHARRAERRGEAVAAHRRRSAPGTGGVYSTDI